MDDAKQDELSFECYFNLERALLQIGRFLQPWQHNRGIEAIFDTLLASIWLEQGHLVIHLRLNLVHRVLGAVELLQIIVALEDGCLGLGFTLPLG